MAYNRSIFPEGGYDVFPEVYDLPNSMLSKAYEFKGLQNKTNKTPEEVERFNTLKVELQNYLITPELFNKFTDSVTGIQKFFVENTIGFIDDLKQEMTDYTNQKQIEIDGTVASFNSHVANEKVIIVSYVDNKKTEMNLYVDDKLNQVQLTATETINIMENKKNLFITYVDTKQSEVHQLVQEFDTRSTRYYQRWTAGTDGQTRFNIYTGGDIMDIPEEAKLILSAKDLDVVVQGVDLTPKIDYDILSNGLYDTIELKGNASSMISAGTEITMKWYKNVGKLYFKHAPTHELNGSDPIKNLQEPQLHPDLKNKINTGNLTISTIKPSGGMWYKVVG